MPPALENYHFIGDHTVLEEAVSQLDHLPYDFVGLIHKVTNMAQVSWWR